MIKRLPKTLLNVISTNDSLSRYLLNLSETVEPTPRSWLYEDQNPDDVLQDWKNHLDRLRKGDSFEQEVFQFDISSEEKWGPQGGHAPLPKLFEEIIAPTFADVSPHPTLFSLDNETTKWGQAIKSVITECRRNGIAGLRPASYRSVVDDMRARDTLESNSGWPDFKRRNIPEIKDAAIRAAENGSYANYPAITLFRTYRKKTRLVWMFPMAANLKEATLYQPLQSAFSNSKIDFYAPWIGFERVRQLITQAYDSGKVVSATDFSSTDAHFKMATSAQAVKVLQSCFTNGVAKSDLYTSIEHMHNIPLVISNTEWVVGPHGVSSGSNWTNFIETVFDRVLAEYTFNEVGVKGFYAIGDDMAWVSDSFRDAFSNEIEQIGREVGQEIKADKATNYPDKVKTLQRLFQRGYRRPDGLLRGVYSTVRALNSSIYPERYHKPKDWSSDMFCARQYMILENCVDHPLFEEFVKFVVAGHRDLIPFAKKSSGELTRILRKTKLLPGLNPTYNQERRDHSLADFDSIRIARAL